jgi:hypothetical protein
MRSLNLIAAGCVVYVVVAGCQKFDIKYRDAAKNCRITSYAGKSFDNNVIHRVFHYNEFGNPTLVEYPETGGGTGTPNFIFTYNDRQQLKKLVGWATHNFTYNKEGRVIIDSLVGDYAGQDSRYEERYFYDVYGRVIKVVSKFYYDRDDSPDVGTVTTNNYKYDMHGNLIVPGVTYDTKKSIYRTHPLWMFLNRNYSLNNAIPADSYNSSGLPTGWSSNSVDFLQSSILLEEVEYDCGGNNK